MTDKLREAAQAIVDRWDSPAWGGSAENLRHTGEYIAELRAALAQQDAQAVVQELSEAFRAELDKVSQRNFELRMEIASLKATPTSPVQQDEQTAPDIGELYAQGWINGGQVQSLIDWCSSYCKKHPSVAFTEGTTRQLAYAIFAALLFYQSEELKFAVNRLKQLVGLVYRGDYSNTETKEWWSQVEEILKDTQAFCALPGEHIQKCAPNTAAPTPTAQKPLGWLAREAVECLQGAEMTWMPLWNRQCSSDPVPIFLGPPAVKESLTDQTDQTPPMQEKQS